MAIWERKKEAVPFTAMEAVESATVGINILYKAATLKGLNYFILIVYSYPVGSLVLVPLPFIFSRRELPPFNLSTLYKIAFVALIGLLNNVCGYKGVEYSSPSLASAMNNLSPAFTFILAVLFRFYFYFKHLFKSLAG